jgi:hypothetical protein
MPTVTAITIEIAAKQLWNRIMMNFPGLDSNPQKHFGFLEVSNTVLIKLKTYAGHHRPARQFNRQF